MNTRDNLYRKILEVVALLFTPLITIFLTKYMVGEDFLDYSLHSDAAWELTYIKLYSNSIFSHIYSDPHMGAPLSITHNFWPWRQIIMGAHYFLIGLFESDILQIFRTFYYSLFPLCALSMFISLRHYIRTSIVVASGIGILYAFIPFITVQHVHASVVINNVGIPLLLGIACYFDNKIYENNSYKEHLLSKKTIITFIIIFLCTSLSLYNCFYFLLILLFLLVKELLSSNKNKTKIYIVSLFILISFLTAVFNIYPHLNFRLASHFTYDYMTRTFVHSTVYGLSIVEFFVPTLDHVFESFRFISSLYVDNTKIQVNFLSSYLGMLGIISFCTSIVYAFKTSNLKDDFTKKLNFLGILSIFIFLVFYRGGLLTAFYLFTDFLVLGSHYRIIPWVSCISLIAAGIILNRFFQIKFVENFYGIIKKISLVLIFIVIIGLSLLDFRGIKKPFEKESSPNNIDTIYNPQKEFYSMLDQHIDNDDIILQIPYVCFPETRYINKTTYGDVWSYLLINKGVKFSWMAFKEGTACSINSQISSMSNKIEEMLKYAIYYGYTGIIINKKGYSDDGRRIIDELKSKFNLNPIIESTRDSYHGEYAFYNIKTLRKTFGSLRITPIEGDMLYEIASFNSNLNKKEISKIIKLFPSPCVTERDKDILGKLEAGDIFQKKDCSGSDLQNKEFFYFANHAINIYPEIKFENEQIKVDKDYIGVIFSIAIHNDLDIGTYKIFLNTNDSIKLDKSFFDFSITQWGKKFNKKSDFAFSLKEKTSSSKHKAVWIHLFKKIKTDNDINIRSVTVRKIND